MWLKIFFGKLTNLIQKYMVRLNVIETFTADDRSRVLRKIYSDIYKSVTRF